MISSARGLVVSSSMSSFLSSQFCTQSNEHACNVNILIHSAHNQKKVQVDSKLLRRRYRCHQKSLTCTQPRKRARCSAGCCEELGLGAIGNPLPHAIGNITVSLVRRGRLHNTPLIPHDHRFPRKMCHRTPSRASNRTLDLNLARRITGYILRLLSFLRLLLLIATADR